MEDKDATVTKVWMVMFRVFSYEFSYIGSARTSLQGCEE